MRVNWINVDEKAKPAVAARRAKTNPSTPQHNGYRIALLPPDWLSHTIAALAA
jgi:hypothetical protein